MSNPKGAVGTVVVSQAGDGDTTDIQTGINLLPAAGGCVYIKEGTYEITATIDIPNNNISIIGCGHSTIIRATAVLVSLMEVGNGVDYFTIEDCLLDGNNNMTSEVLRFSGTSTRSKVSGCWFENWGPIGIYLIGEIDATIIENNVFELINDDHSVPNYAISILDSYSCYIKGNFIRGGNAAALVQGVRITATLAGRALFNSIVDNKIVGVDYGIYIDGATGASQQQIISNNFISTALGGTAGININASEANLISNNFLISSLIPSGIGINITTNSHENAMSNNFMAYFVTGVNIATGSDENIINGNQIYATVGATTGVNIANNTCDGTIITSNEFISQPTNISDAGTNTKIEHNYPGKIRYWSCNGYNFNTRYHQAANMDDYTINNGTLIVDEDSVVCSAPVTGIPNGAIVTGAIVYGNISDESWYLRRIVLSTAAVTDMANANINTEDTTITTPTIDNITYGYYFETTTLDNGDQIYGARITYTI